MRKQLKMAKIVLLLCLWTISTWQLLAQDVLIQGKVTDASNGEVLPGVSVIIKGTTRGTVTNVDGNYTISASQGAVITFSMIGFKTGEITVGGATMQNVALEPDVAKLSEVVVIGYGTVKKSDATGSLNVVSTKDFNRGSITSPQDLLMGKAAGVVITSDGGAPGANSTIRIRGGSSLSANNSPLIVIDGVPIATTNKTDNTSDVSGLSNPLASINPNDIETFTVLKDASATAIYGSRASNGVIIITTKKGEKGFKVSYNGTASVYTVPRTIEVLNADEFRSLVTQKFPKGLSLLGSAKTDWQKEIFNTAFGHDHNLSVSGTTYKIPYRVSLGYQNQDGILKTSNMNRTTLGININPTFLDDHLHFNLNAKGAYNNTRFADQGTIGQAIQFDPTQPVKNNGKYQQGYFAWMNGSSLNSQGVSNPVAFLNLTSDKADVYRFIGNLQTDYKFHFLPDLRANLNLAYDYSESNGHKYTPDSTSWTTSFEGERKHYTQTKKMELLDFYLNYVKQLDPISSKFDFTVGYSWQHFWAKTSEFTTNDLATTIRTDKYNKTQNYLLSFFGRLNYTLMDKYLLTFTLRDDGSSRFAPNNRWGLFPSMAFAWKIRNESFLQNVNMLSDLKLRLGYGVTGQQDISKGDYPYLALYTRSTSDNTAQYQLGNSFYSTLRPEGYDPKIKWESTTTYNIGLDYGLFNNRITGAIDVYTRKTKDLINFIPVAAGSNLTNYITTNVGDLENKGFEFSITGKVLNSKDWNWDLTYNIGYNKNKITKMTVNDDPSYIGVATGGIAGGVGNYAEINSVGYSVNSFYMYKQAYDSKGNPVEGAYVDLNGDGIINSSDLYRYKKAAADVLMGISSRLSYKNWDFSFSGRVSLGNYIYNNVASKYGTYYDVYNGGTFFMSNVVKQSNNTHFANAQYLSDYYVENGSFFRMDNISLGYNFKNFLKEKINLRVSAVVQNAFIITNYRGLDPEVFSGIDNNVYPRPRTFVFGVNLDF